MRSAREFLDFADALRATRRADETLRVITDAAARMTVSAQATVRLLDPDSGLLLLGTREGEAMHRGGAGRFNDDADASALGWCAGHKRALTINDPERDERFVVREGQTWMPSGIMAAPLLERDTVLGVVSVARREGWPYLEHDLDTLRLLCELASPFLQIDRLRDLAEHDALTGLHNRHHLDRLFPKLLYRAQRRAEPLSAIMLDLDRFGEINKTFGWDVGDVALRTAAETIRANTRVVDTVIRAGGEEFLVLLPGTSVDEAEVLAERLRTKLVPASFERGGRSVRLSASLGVGPVLPGDNVAALLERLGRPVQLAKRCGRNRMERTQPSDATWETFFDGTRADWRRVPAPPEREPDYVSAGGSRYWDAGDGVYRAADHWNEVVGGCCWLLDGEVVSQEAVGYVPYARFKVGPARIAPLEEVGLPAIDWSAYRRIVVLTGDGMMPPRELAGLDRAWDRLDARSMDRLDVARLVEDPDGVREAFLARAERARRSRPNEAHRALARLEAQLEPEQSLTILTQNVDGLHQRAGNAHVVELHGRLSRLRCSRHGCGHVVPSFAAIDACPDCGSAMRPDVVLMGEPLPARTERDIKQAMRGCDLFLAVGVWCAHSTIQRIVRSAVFEGARRIRVHPEPLDPVNPAFDTNLVGAADEILPPLLAPADRRRA